MFISWISQRVLRELHKCLDLNVKFIFSIMDVNGRNSMVTIIQGLALPSGNISL